MESKYWAVVTDDGRQMCFATQAGHGLVDANVSSLSIYKSKGTAERVAAIWNERFISRSGKPYEVVPVDVIGKFETVEKREL